MLLDGLAVRYGCRPSELLRSDPLALSIDLACYAISVEELANVGAMPVRAV